MDGHQRTPNVLNVHASLACELKEKREREGEKEKRGGKKRRSFVFILLEGNAVQWGVILSWQESLLNVTSTRWDPLPNRQLAFLSCYGLFIMRPQSRDFLLLSAKTHVELSIL